MPSSVPDPAALIPVIDGISGPWGLMALLLFVTFVLHLLLMNALVGAAALTLFAKLRPSWLRAGEHDPDMLLPKGVALVVNLGVPPFLFLQGIYGQYVYSSSVIMAVWWLSVMMVVMLAYYGFYFNMSRRGISDSARTLSLALAVALLLLNAFLFVNNVTLFQSPERWLAYGENAGGTFLNLADPQVLPRYLHVILSCLAVGGLSLALHSAFSLRSEVDEHERTVFAVRERKGLAAFTLATLLQLPVGVWFLMALPQEQRLLFMGGSAFATALFAASLVLAAASILFALRRRTSLTALFAVLTIVLMAGMRTLLRSSMLEPWYAQPMKPLDASPLAFFVIALVLSGIGVAWVGKMYFSRGRAVEAPPDPEAARRLRDEAHAVRLVNEIALARVDALPDPDDDEDDEDEREGGRS